MELVPGLSLDDKLAAGALPQQEAVRLGLQLVEGVDAAHAEGIVHRDLKPANLRVTPTGQLKILDFGLARQLPREGEGALTATLTQSQEVTGTLPYMAPEQLRGEGADFRSDIWAIGAVLYEMCTGRRPFDSQFAAVLAADIIHKSPVAPRKHNPNLSAAMEAIILRCLEKDAADRYQSTRELRKDLEKVSVGAPVAALSRRRWLAITAGVMTVFLLAVSGYLLLRWRPKAPAPAPVNLRRSVAVLGFKNLSGRPEAGWVSTALSEMLTTELAAGEQLRTISGETVARVRSDLTIGEADSLAPDTLAKLRKSLNSDFVVLGSYLDLGTESGGQIRLDLRLQDARTGEALALVSEKGAESQLDDLVVKAGAQLRQKLGAGEVTPAEAAGVKAALPSNPEAARLYSEGLEKLRAFDSLGVRDLLEKAVAADPSFALAYSGLATAWKAMGYDSNARAEAKKSLDLSSNLSRQERLWIEGQSFEITSQWPKAVETYHTLFEFFPDNLDYGLRLAAAQVAAGKGKDALATVGMLRKLPSPASDDVRIDLAEASASASVGDFKRQQQAATRAVGRAAAEGARLLLAEARIAECSSLRYLGKPKESVSACEDARQIFAAAGDRSGVARALNNIGTVHMEEGDLAEARKTYEDALATNRAIGAKKAEGMVLNNLAGVLRSQADLAGSRKMLEEAQAAFREIGDKGGVARSLDNIGIVLVDEGRLEEARKRYNESLTICRELGNQSLTAYALSLLGDVYYAQGNLSEARKSHESALDIRNRIGEQRVIAVSQMALANLSLEEGKLAAAESAAREVAGRFENVKDADSEALAYAVLARALREQGKITEARDAVEHASTLSKESGDASVHIAVDIEAAQLRAASRNTADVAAAETMLQGTLTNATKEALTGLQFQARLALGEIETKSGDPRAGRARLIALEKDATKAGYLLVARKSRAARRA
ncbi:MAG TPA: tetratricopeptide repeat protein [Terriglobales bacterium]|jgi:tetratricopeptide (TPR) repeat protein|nr:tetratricopeptide repeat protein [Terriglobales bacterium]